MTIYRIHRADRAAEDFTGAMLAGGRWNATGVPMLYAAQHLSLACLEILVHLDRTQIPSDYAWSSTDLPRELEILRVDSPHDVDACQAAGSEWVRKSNQLGTQVASAIIPKEFNILLNPNHSAYKSLVWSGPQSFHFDPRMFEAKPEML